MSMKNTDVILQFLKQNNLALCDDCLSDKTGIKPRQQIYQICSNLGKNQLIKRKPDRCSHCGKEKIVNSFHSNNSPNQSSNLISTQLPKSPTNSSDIEPPWYWEGNIQAALVTFLVTQGYSITRVSDTASRENGKDVEAVGPNGKKLWVSVKGWPEKSANTQARHWFSQALFDMILYRDESRDAELALAFPDGFQTYLNLARRIQWFRDAGGFRIFWVSEKGSVRIE